LWEIHDSPLSPGGESTKVPSPLSGEDPFSSLPSRRGSPSVPSPPSREDPLQSPLPLREDPLQSLSPRERVRVRGHKYNPDS